MTGRKVTYNVKDFFHVNTETFRVDDALPFDCFLHLEKNDKFIHWLKQGSIFTADRKSKLSDSDHPPLLILNIQKPAYLKYVDSVEIAINPAVKKYIVFGDFVSKHAQVSAEKQSPKPVAAAKARVDVDFINTLIQATREVFLDQFKITVESRAPTKRTDKVNVKFEIDVASFVTLTSQTIRGTIGLCFPTQTYFNLLRKITEIPYEELTPELHSGCAEIMCSIYETVRPRLVDLGYLIDQAVPSLIVGHNLSLPHLIPDQGFSVVFESSEGVFQFEVGIKTGA